MYNFILNFATGHLNEPDKITIKILHVNIIYVSRKKYHPLFIREAWSCHFPINKFSSAKD